MTLHRCLKICQLSGFDATQLGSCQESSGQCTRPDGECAARVEGRKLQFQVVKDGSAVMGKDSCEALGLVRWVNTTSKRQQEKTVPVIEVEGPNAQ